MSELNNSESKFGFKDKEKAVETLQLLESHEMQYRKLTVRGLLGRAKRVLTMTKALNKINSINEAIEVFENWLDENGGGASNKNSKTDKDDKVETVPGLGFKDNQTARETIRNLEDRDPDYQRLAVKGLIGNAKRVLNNTKNEDKIKAIQDGIKVLEDFLERFETENMIKKNRAYLPYTLIKCVTPPSQELVMEFLRAYGGAKAKGNYKHLRNMYPEKNNRISWDIIRNREIAQLLDKLQSPEMKLFEAENGAPTNIHLELIHWAYSPQPDKLRAYVENIDGGSKSASAKKSAEKRKTTNAVLSSDEDKKNDVNNNTDSDDSATPQKKRKILDDHVYDINA